MSRGGSPLAVVLLLAASTSVASAERIEALGFDFTSNVWSVADQSAADEVMMATPLGLQASVEVDAVRDGWTCAALLATAPVDAPRTLPGLLEKEQGVVMPRGLLVCREVRGRRISIAAPYPGELPVEMQQRVLSLLVNEVDAALAAQTALRLPRSGWELGPYFARWQPRLGPSSDQLYLVGPSEVATRVAINRNALSGCAKATAGGYTRTKRPAYVPTAFGTHVMVGDNEGDSSTLVCLEHGAGRYDIEVTFALGGKKKPDKATEKSVREILDAIARAIKASPPIPDAVSEASEEVSDEPSPTPAPTPAPSPTPAPTPDPTPTVGPDNSPEAVARRLAMLEEMQRSSPDTLSSSSSSSSSYATSSRTDIGSTRGWWAESPTLVVQLRRIGIDETMAAPARDAIGGTLTLAKPLVIGEVGGVEYGGTVGYDELSGVSYDVRAGAGMILGGSLTALVGVGLDAWNGTEDGVELPADIYAYLGVRIPIGPLSVRAEYLPRNGGGDEKRVRLGLTRLRHAGRKLVAEGNAQFLDGATVLTFGLGVGI
jgi:hypothetical protein